jgi:glyoxylase-like metal-dependent hydrolase (beta-lactamase superfamily II)
VDSAAPSLVYPLAIEPAVGDGAMVQAAPGVGWMRMPLREPLQFINVWLLEESDGFTLVDTGVFSEPTQLAWTRAFESALVGSPLRRIVVTHMHPDHCGMAGWLQQRVAAPLWMSRLEYLSCRAMVADTGIAAPAAALEFYRAAGWDDAALERYRERFGFFGRAVSALPACFSRLVEDASIVLGDTPWQVVIGRGHSPEHVCLYSESRRLLISGDQILPRISSNVSVHPMEPDADPLQDWLSSLRHIRARVPDDVLVLPAHNSPFHGLHARIDEMIASHHRKLKGLQASLTQPMRAVDVFGLLFRRVITSELLGMATGEALAHLNYLMAQGTVQRRSDERGVQWYQAQ